MIGLSWLSLLGQKGSPGKWRKQPTVYREHVRPICHPLKVDLFQCYYVHYASCGSVQQYNDQVYILSLWVGGVTVWGAGLGGSSSLKLLWRGVFWFLHLRGRPTCFLFFLSQGNKRLWGAFCCLLFKITWTCLPSWMFPHVSAPLLWASHLLDGCDWVSADWTVWWYSCGNWSVMG